jgi:outer membrane protein assembly factor BamB
MNDAFSQVPPAPPSPAPAPPDDIAAPRPAPPATRRPRLWPAVAVVALMWLVISGPWWGESVSMMRFMAVFWGPVVAAAALVIWQLFFSRLRWIDRLLGLAAGAATGAAAAYLADFPAMILLIYALPVVLTAWVGWLLVGALLRLPFLRLGLLAVFLLSWGAFDLLSVDGFDGSLSPSWRFRWGLTDEQKFLAYHAGRRVPSQAAAPALALQPGDWPGFRGRYRDGRLPRVRLAADWASNPPPQVWRHPVGPGWSSFAVVGDRLYTQEQRDKDEAVVCYNADTGDELWAHTDPTRFKETVSGVGPRATPTFHDGKIYALGARGVLNCLDAATGEVKWAKDIVKDSGAEVPTWGFSSSPLVVQGVVTVFAGGPDGKSVLGYDAESGELAWARGDGKLSYCSTHRALLGGVEQVLIATDQGLTAFDPVGGKVLWQYDSPLPSGGARIIQPTVLSDTDLLVGAGFGEGTRRVHVTHRGDDWTTEEVWTSKAINPYFNDLVVYGDCLYGFDGTFLTCVSLADGQGKWRARGYGGGQVLLLADQGLLLVVTEREGAVALVEASPERHKELCRFQALEKNSKTWNHPVVAGGKLFVRNDAEAACYRLTLAAGSAAGE